MREVELIVSKPDELSDRSLKCELDLKDGEIVDIIRYPLIGEDVAPGQYEDHRVASHRATNSLVGKLLTLIDATFSDPEQRKAMKDLFVDTIWGWQNNK